MPKFRYPARSARRPLAAQGASAVTGRRARSPKARDLSGSWSAGSRAT